MFDKKEEIYYTVIFTSIFVFVLIGIVIYALLLYLKRKRKHIADKAAFHTILLSSRLEIKEDTLRYIGRELHDNLGQVASLIKINLTTLQLNDPVKAAAKIDNSKELLRQLITDIKSLSVSLGADRINQKGLTDAIQTEIARLNKTGTYTASFSINGYMPPIGNDTTVILFRMVQESINNIVKHSKATTVAISATVTEKLFTLVLHDNGTGFNLKDKLGSGGAGLRNLFDRAALIKATLDIVSFPGKGTTVTISLPR